MAKSPAMPPPIWKKPIRSLRGPPQVPADQMLHLLGAAADHRVAGHSPGDDVSREHVAQRRVFKARRVDGNLLLAGGVEPAVLEGDLIVGSRSAFVQQPVEILVGEIRLAASAASRVYRTICSSSRRMADSGMHVSVTRLKPSSRSCNFVLGRQSVVPPAGLYWSWAIKLKMSSSRLAAVQRDGVHGAARISLARDRPSSARADGPGDGQEHLAAVFEMLL